MSFSTGYSSKLESRIDVRLDTNDDYAGITYEITGQEADVVLLENRIEEWIDSVKQWYTAITTEGLLSGTFFYLVGVAIWAAAWFLRYESIIKPRTETIFGFIGMAIQLLSYFWGRLRRWVFPVGVFAFGGGIEKLQAIRARQQVFSFVTVITVVVSFLTSILANWLSK